MVRTKREAVWLSARVLGEADSSQPVLEMAAFFCCLLAFFFVPTCLPPPLRKWRMDVINPPPSRVGTRDMLWHVSFPFIVMCCEA